MDPFPFGKLPHDEMARFFNLLLRTDERVFLGPGIGLDCAVIDFGDTYLVAKSDPITFTADEIGTYVVQINANDIATTGAQPRWFLATLLLPPGMDKHAIQSIFNQLQSACSALNTQLVGGHTEITKGLDRPIICGTMLGEVRKENLITPQGASAGDVVLLSKGIPLEAASILARDFEHLLSGIDQETIRRARNYLHDPGISIVAEAMIAANTGGVTAMHDPTEGGLAGALWELAEAAQVGILVEEAAIPVLDAAGEICSVLGIPPMEAISSGALLLTVRSSMAEEIIGKINAANILIAEIGVVTADKSVVLQTGDGPQEIKRPARDALAVFFEHDSAGA